MRNGRPLNGPGKSLPSRTSHRSSHVIEQKPKSIDGCIAQGQSFDLCETSLFSPVHLNQQRVAIRMGTSQGGTENTERVRLTGEIVERVGKAFRLFGHMNHSLVAAIILR